MLAFFSGVCLCLCVIWLYAVSRHGAYAVEQRVYQVVKKGIGWESGEHELTDGHC